jgi:hypothetical protein
VFGDHLIAQVLLSTVVVFLFIISLVGLGLGVGLLLRSASVLPFIGLMNHWVSTRQALKPLESQLRLGQAASGARWFGFILIALGGYSALTLIGSFDVHRLATLFRVDARYSLTGVGLDVLKWFLVVGSVGAIGTGIMLLFFPHAWRNIEARANHWYSTRNLELAGDTVYLSLDRMVQTFPRTAGAILFAMSLVAATASGILLFARR